MTGAAKTKDDVTEAEEGEYSVADIFFSRTDERGVIQAGNRTFRRVSGYSWDEMVGKPHKLVRHPDMPAGVFWLFWNELKAGRTVGAYVQNRTKHGKSYWVFATATPVDGGFLSVRIKPTSGRLEMIQDEYARLRVREQKEDLSPEQSAKILLERLQEAGHRNYHAFQAAAGAEETRLRDEAMGREPPRLLTVCTDIVGELKKMTEEAGKLPKILERLKLTQVNMGVLASRIETAGGPISAIAGIYSHMTDEIGHWIDSFLGDSGNAFATMQDAVEDASFLFATASVQAAMCGAFHHTTGAGARFNIAEEQAILEQLSDRSIAKAKAEVKEVAAAARKMSNAASELKREVMRLGSTRMLCEIESARLTRRSESFEEVVRRLALLQEEIEARQSRIEDAANRVLKDAALVRASHSAIDDVAAETEDGADKSDRKDAQPVAKRAEPAKPVSADKPTETASAEEDAPKPDQKAA